VKILQVSGENLASLERFFEVDFEEGPLGAAGLFGITGPTGAGKSTLLDAVCLPLYDRTPRLSGSGGVEVGVPGEETLRSTDPRSILRKGAGAGWAQVRFEGKDGRPYRARWSVRRARNAPGGRLQSQTLELYDEADQSLGGTKTETLARIEALLGLSFDQFCRSVLLAQGDFAAFLKAKPAERAELLERMTGTGLYAELSRGAFAKARDARAELESLEERLQGAVLLGEEERAALQARVEAADGELRQAQAALDEARRAEQWWAARARLDREAQAAVQERVGAQEAWEAAAADRDLLAQVRRAEALRAVLQEADRAEAERATAEEEVARREEELGDLAAALARAEEARAAAARALDSAREDRERLGPELARARELDVLLTRADRDRREAAAAREAARKVAEEAVSRLRGLEARRAAAARQMADAEAWLAAHRPDEPVAREWGRWEAELARCAEAAAALAALAREEPSAAGARESAQGRLRAAEQALATAQTALAAALTELEGRRAAAAELPRRGSLERQGSLAAVERALADLRSTAAGALRLVQEAQAAQEAAGHLRTRAAGEEQAAGEWEARRNEIDGRLGAARAALRLAELSASLETHRAQLRPGSPCPLCGAIEHPWAPVEGGAPTPGEADGHRREASELEEAARAAGQELAAARQRAAGARGQAGEEERRAQAALQEAEALRKAWERGREKLPDVPLPADPADPASLPAADRALEAVRADLAEVGRALQDAEGRAASAAEAQAGADAARKEVEEARRAREAAAEALRQAERTLAELAARQRQERASLERAADALAGAIPGWEEARTRLLADPEAFRRGWGERVAAWQAQEQGRAAARASLAEIEPQVQAAAAEARALAGREAEAAEACRLAQNAHGALARDRGVLLGGRPADEAEAEARARVSQAERADREAQARVAAAGKAASAAEGRLAAARVALEEARAREVAARGALEAALVARALALPDLRALLARGERWVEETAARLEALERARTQAATVAEERRRVLAEHEASGAPAGARSQGEAAEAALARSREVEALREAREALRVELRRDDEECRRAEELRPRIEEQRRRAGVWAALSELIGSHDGKKFRTFAQSLTLEVLLAHANEHLGSLARRYRLERVPGAELDLQVVDQDMGDEVRSVNSLSGGESFLASLALALGLSSLSARDTRVDSLFVDEGFGSLDPDTLDAALAALDALQAGGRQVGVISHVPGLAERLGARVEVRPLGGGASAVRVRGAA
jgi:exonuclease SbcC